MCGRTACTLAPNEISRACAFKDRHGKSRQPYWVDAPGGQQYKSSYNLAPGAHTPVLLSSDVLKKHSMGVLSNVGENTRVVMPMKWGLTPPWHQGDPYKVPYETNNCRAEGMLEKKTYKVPLQKGNRCVILADGFFEWKTSKTEKQPYFFYFPSKSLQPVCKGIKEELKAECSPRKPGQSQISAESVTDNEGGQDKLKIEPDSCSMRNYIGLSDLKTDAIETPELSWKEENVSSDENERFNIRKGTASNAGGKDFHSMKKEGFERLHEDLHSDEGGVSSCRQERGDYSEDASPRLLTMAGVFDVWKANQSSEPLYSYSIITVPSSPDMDWCHHRMPAVLSGEAEIEQWLDTATVPLNKAVSLIKPKVCLSHHAVGKQVNNARYQNADCVKPVAIRLQQPKPSSEGSQLMHKWLQSASPAKRKPGDAEKSGAHTDKKMKANINRSQNLMLNWLHSGSPQKAKKS